MEEPQKPEEAEAEEAPMEEVVAAEAEAPVAAPAVPQTPEVAEVACNVDEACASGSAPPLPTTSGMIRIAAMADFQRIGWLLTTSLGKNAAALQDFF